MKIVVLAGGLSTERAVSLVTGADVCRALRERGHLAILVDLILGLEELPEDPEEDPPQAVKARTTLSASIAAINFFKVFITNTFLKTIDN